LYVNNTFSPQLLILGKAFERSIMSHNEFLPPDVVNVLVEKVCIGYATILVPTNKITIMVQTFKTFVVWSRFVTPISNLLIIFYLYCYISHVYTYINVFTSIKLLFMCNKKFWKRLLKIRSNMYLLTIMATSWIVVMTIGSNSMKMSYDTVIYYIVVIVSIL